MVGSPTMFHGLKLSPVEVRSELSETYDQELGNGHSASVPDDCCEGTPVDSSSLESSPPEKTTINTTMKTTPQNHFRFQKGFFSRTNDPDTVVSGCSEDFLGQKYIMLKFMI